MTKKDADCEASPLQVNSPEPSKGWISWRLFGPGLLVCLADTDAGCLIVAAQSGARWGYAFLILQIALIPVLFITQELTVRLGIYTQQGHTACIKQHFGSFWAWFACILLLVECTGAMVSEMSGIAAVAELYGFHRTVATAIASLVICSVVLFCNYRTVEIIGVTLGLCELTFVVTMFLLHPPLGEVIRGSFVFYGDSKYIELYAANIGAVIMPWMIYFQQSAVVARRLRGEQDLKEERAQTLFGSCLTQLVMIGMLVTLAADKTKPQNLEGVRDIVVALEPVLGAVAAKTLVSIGFVGGSLCGAFVVSLAASWALCEAIGSDSVYSLDQSPANAPAFYGFFMFITILGAVILLTGVDIVKLNVFVEFMDGVLMPMAVGFLYFLATSDILPPDKRVTGVYKHVLAVIFSTCSALTLGSAIYSILHQ